MLTQPIEIRVAPGKGRGLFACAPIARGDVIERAPTIELSDPDTDAIVGTELEHYYFAHPGHPDEGGLMVLGMSSVSNHSDTPNAARRCLQVEGLGWVFELYALHDIPAGAEILHTYACGPWFEVAG
ncbi:MAG: SET domain-containing protein-lysine N-methyltransferase [Alphaproteobacteria bacterium]|nr:SET domain-containing protein-lysine N-methyltransferase [Alphaproteobacteria bacterium]